MNKLLYQNSIPNYIQEENILSESIMQNNQNNQNEPIIRFNQSDSDSDDRKLDDENQGNFQLNRIVESQNLNANNVIKNENDLEKFKRGEEKGYFMPGGSTIVVLVNNVKVDSDIIKYSSKGIETIVTTGEKVGDILC